MRRGGARAGAPADPAARVVRPAARVQPARTEPVARGVIERLGGPVGRRALIGRQRWWTPLRVLLTLALTFLALGYLSKANCLFGTAETGVNWSGNRPYMSACYNDILPLYSGRGLDDPGDPYAYSWSEDGRLRYMEYPVLAGWFQAILGAVAHYTFPVVRLLLDVPEASWYFTLTALVLACMWLVVIRLVAELAGNRVWDVVLVAASPVIVMHAFTNWDIPSILCAVAALVAVKRDAPVWAGVWIGVGTAVKLWPLFLLGAFLVLAVRSNRWRPFLAMTGAAAVVWLAVNLPVMLAHPEAWGEFNRLNSTRGAEWTTIYQVFTRVTGVDLSVGFLNTASFVLFAGACLAVALLGLAARRRPRVSELVFLIVAAFLLFNKVWSPQYSLWLVVPAVLALPRWRLLLTWMTLELLMWPATMIFIGAEEGNKIPAEMFNLLILARDGFIVAMAVLVVRQMLGRSRDRVLAAHRGVDVLAGPFGIDDAPWVAARARRSGGRAGWAVEEDPTVRGCWGSEVSDAAGTDTGEEVGR